MASGGAVSALSWLWPRSAEPRACRAVEMIWAKALAGVLPSGYDVGALVHHYPRWGRHVRDTTLLYTGSLGENPF